MSAALTIDGGGSGSRARLRLGAAATTVSGRPLNLTNLPQETILRHLDELLAALAPLPADLHVSVGVAGGGNPARAEPLTGWLSTRLPDATVAVGRDVDLLLAQLDGDGAALIVGTGAIAVARGPAGEVVVDGHGFLLGDRGGGAWIAQEALRGALRAHDRDGGSAPLLSAMTAAAGAPSAPRLAAALTAGGHVDVARLASLAPIVLAHAGDPVADAVAERAAELLVETVEAALRRSGAAVAAPTIAAGGLLDGDAFAARLTAALPGPLRRVDPLDSQLAAAQSRQSRPPR